MRIQDQTTSTFRIAQWTAIIVQLGCLAKVGFDLYGHRPGTATWVCAAGVAVAYFVLRKLQAVPHNQDDAHYDAALLEYLEIWRTAPSVEEHKRLAKERFGLDEDGVEFVNQVLSSAAFGTLGNWANSQDDPWWQAAARLAYGPRRGELRGLAKSLGATG